MTLITTRHCASTVYAMFPCLCVWPSQASIVQRWLNLGSCKQCRKYPSDSSFMTTKISMKFECSHLQLGHQIQVG